MNDGQVPEVCLPLRSVLEAAPPAPQALIHSSHEEAGSGRDQPPQKQEARAHSNKALKEAIISGLPIPEQSTGSQISSTAVIASGCWQN